MASNDYAFVTHWRVKGTREEVFDLLSKPEELARWWPSVYLDVKVLDVGQAGGLGKTVELLTQGWLPYRLRWTFKTTESMRPSSMALEAFGDFVGRGQWTFTQDGEWVDITYDWRIRADKPVLRYLSFLFKPIFAGNHLWAMARGRESLTLELERRRGSNVALAQPRGPVSAWWSGSVLAAIATVCATSVFLLAQLVR